MGVRVAVQEADALRDVERVVVDDPVMVTLDKNADTDPVSVAVEMVDDGVELRERSGVIEGVSVRPRDREPDGVQKPEDVNEESDGVTETVAVGVGEMVDLDGEKVTLENEAELVVADVLLDGERETVPRGLPDTEVADTGRELVGVAVRELRESEGEGAVLCVRVSVRDADVLERDLLALNGEFRVG